MKDFFYEVFHEMVSADSGMFMFNDSKTLAWFPSKQPKQEDQRYFQFGVLCGLALYNKCIIHLPFPLALFKKLLGVKPSLSDMIEFSPSVGESLLNILED
ncbi:E3 ISG15--protein ligase HERC5-like [Epinephelus lanceolatus]